MFSLFRYLKRTSPTLYVLLFSSIASPIVSAETFNISYNAKTYEVLLGTELEGFSANSVGTGEKVNDAEILNSLFHGAKAIERIRQYDPENDQFKVMNELNIAVDRTNRNFKEASVFNGIEATSGILTSAATELIKLKTNTVACGLGSALNCKAVAVSPYTTFADSVGGTLAGFATTQTLIDQEINFLNTAKSSIVDLNYLAAEHEKNKQILSLPITATLPQIIQADLLMQDVQQSAQDLIPILDQVGRIDNGTVLERINKGIVTSVDSAVTNLPISTALGVYEFVASSDDSEIAPEELYETFHYWQSPQIAGEHNVFDPFNLQLTQDHFMSAELKLYAKAKEEESKKFELESTKVALDAGLASTEAKTHKASYESEVDYLETLEAVRSSQWKDLSDMRSELDKLSDGIVNANNVQELEKAIDAASDERRDAKSLKKIHDKRYEGLTIVLADLEKGALESCYAYVGCFKQSQISDVKLYKAESYNLLQNYIDYFDRKGGLDDIYDAARDQLAALKAFEQKQSEHQMLNEKSNELAQQAQQAQQDAVTALENAEKIELSEIPEELGSPKGPLTIYPKGNADDELLAKLVTGSPISLSQEVDVPNTSTKLIFDYLFESGSGQLDVLLNNQLIGQLYGSEQPDFLTASMNIGSSLLGQENVEITFLFQDDQAGSLFWLDNVIFPGIVNGNFDFGLTYWTPKGDGFAVVTNYAELVSDDNNLAPVPVPAAFWLFGSVLLGFTGFRKYQAKKAS